MVPEPGHKIPTCVTKWINERGAAASGSRSILSADSKIESTRAKGMPKAQSSQNHQIVALKTVKHASKSSSPAAYVPPTLASLSNAEEDNDRCQIHPGVQDPSQSVTASLDNVPSFLVNDLLLIQVFKEMIYPCIKASAKTYHGIISKDVLDSIGESVSY